MSPTLNRLWDAHSLYICSPLFDDGRAQPSSSPTRNSTEMTGKKWREKKRNMRREALEMEAIWGAIFAGFNSLGSGSSRIRRRIECVGENNGVCWN